MSKLKSREFTQADCESWQWVSVYSDLQLLLVTDMRLKWVVFDFIASIIKSHLTRSVLMSSKIFNMVCYQGLGYAVYKFGDIVKLLLQFNYQNECKLISIVS